MSLANGETSGTSVTRRETIGELGAFVKLDVPEVGTPPLPTFTSPPPSSPLVLGALLIAFIPVPRSGRGRGRVGEPHWSSDPRAPYAGWEPAHPAAAPSERSGDRRR